MAEPENIDVCVTCPSCGERLSAAEEASPRTGDDADVLCDACYREFYEFDCCWCEEYDDDEYQHVLLVVFDALEAGVDLPGVYRINETPYYSQPLVGQGRLWEDSLTWLGYLQACLGDGSPCGHLCQRCQRTALAEVLYGTRCGCAALAAGGHHA